MSIVVVGGEGDKSVDGIGVTDHGDTSDRWTDGQTADEESYEGEHFDPVGLTKR